MREDGIEQVIHLPSEVPDEEMVSVSFKITIIGRVNGLKQWDDGNQVNGDGCDSNWQKEPGWTWTTPVGLSSKCTKDWGNGIRDKDELWDDGDEEDGIGWKSDWSGAIPGYIWTLQGTKDEWISLWGDGFRVIGESWDDGNDEEQDGWFQCQIKQGWKCHDIDYSGGVKR